MDDIVSLTKKFENTPKLSIPELPAGAVILVRTDHSDYMLKVLDPQKCLVEASGGYFTRRKKAPCITTVVGSTFGGSMIYKGFLIEGMFCEFDLNVVTSTIRQVSVLINN